MEKKVFEKGDFIKYHTYCSATENKVTFGIFEGVDLAPEYQYAKKYSLVVYYDSHKYYSDLNSGGGWGYKPSLEVSKDGKYCEKTAETLVENEWWSVCTPAEKKEAIEKLAEYDYEWDEENLSLIDTKTGEIVHKIIIPKIEYNGETIKPICKDFKNKLKNSIISKPQASYGGGCHYPYNNDENWD